MADNNSFKNNIDALIGGMEGYLNTKTVVGDAIKVGDSYLLPIADVSFGLGAGVFGNDDKAKGGGGVGAKITPTAMLVVTDGNPRILSLKDNPGLLEKIIEIAPGIISKFTKKDTKESKTEEIFGEK